MGVCWYCHWGCYACFRVSQVRGKRVKHQPGDKLVGPFGHMIRIDFIDKSEVFYVAWKPTWQVGNPIRKDIDEFCELVQESGLELILDHPRQRPKLE